MKKLQTLAAAWMCVFLVTAGNAHADSFALSQVSIDWSAMTFTGIPIDFVPDTLFSFSNAQVGSDGLFDSEQSTAAAWTNTFASAVASSVVDGQGALAEGTALTSDSEISASLFQSAAGRGEALGNVGANRVAQVIARETGMLTLSAPVTMSTMVSGVQSPHEVAGTWSSASFSLFTLSGTSRISFDQLILDRDPLGPDPFVDSRDVISRTLSTSVFFEAGQLGSFGAGVFSTGFATAVPEPGSLLLLGCGLAGMVAARRRLGQRRRT